MRTSIPDIKIKGIELLNQTEDVLTWQRIFTGTHKKAFKGIPASNKKLNWYEMLVTRFENEKIVEEWVVSDLAFQMVLKLKKK